MYDFQIGTKFIPIGQKNKSINTVIDILTTTNKAGEIVKTSYVATHEFCGQIVTNHDVPGATIARGLIKTEAI